MTDRLEAVIRDPTRLAALRRLALMDSGAEPAFDRITRMASRLLHAPIALVTLVDEDRQFFKSGVGLPEPWASRRQTPLSHSICRHAVATGEPLIISDTRRHPLVSDSPAITDLGIMAYLGIPLRAPDGPVLGSFCVIDTQPRDWSEEEVQMLQDLAAWVMTEIALRSEAVERTWAEYKLAETITTQRSDEDSTSQANPAKSDLVSIVSHQFGTPLTVIQGFSELILNEPLSPEEIREYAGDIHEEATRLARMISQMRDLDRMEAGELRLDVETIDLNQILTQAVESVRPQAPTNPLDLQIDPAVPPLEGDHDRLTEAVTSLLSNALKHSPEGGTVGVTSRLEGDAVHVTVQDRGAGFPPEALAQVFERYSRIDSVANRSFKGTGLGLSLAHRIVRMHGGAIWAESEPGQGSTFHFTLPLAGPGGET